MPGHFSSACLNLGTGIEDLPTPAPAKRAHVSPFGPSEDVAEVKLVLSPSPGVSCPITEAVTRNREADRRRKKTKLPRDAISNLPVLSSSSNPADSSRSDSSRNGKPGPLDPCSGKSKGRYPS
ncbi:hypothetical protein Peur_039648 [Populus x canadensis]|uniref:Uncharacterized protein n=1 Tax=Populus deltoides TaxID=3696 RepID=A0A8T2ZTI0_POPDE|nr:hypothetical protein H0E87_002063 [Populus deltoides]